MEFFRQKSKDLGIGWRSRISRSCGYLGLTLGLIGCGTIKKAGIVATAAGTGAIAGTVLSGGVTAPILGATTTAFVADVVTEVTDMTPTTMENSCAPDNFWTILGKLVEVGGWALILIVVAPIILGWILPGPLEKKKK